MQDNHNHHPIYSKPHYLHTVYNNFIGTKDTGTIPVQGFS